MRMSATDISSNPSIGTSHHSLERGVAMSVQTHHHPTGEPWPIFFGGRKDLEGNLCCFWMQTSVADSDQCSGCVATKAGGRVHGSPSGAGDINPRERVIAYNNFFRTGRHLLHLSKPPPRALLRQHERLLSRRKKLCRTAPPFNEPTTEGLMEPWNTNRHCQLSCSRHAVVPGECARGDVTRARTTSNRALLGRVTDRCLYSFSAS